MFGSNLNMFSCFAYASDMFVNFKLLTMFFFYHLNILIILKIYFGSFGSPMRYLAPSVIWSWTLHHPSWCKGLPTMPSLNACIFLPYVYQTNLRYWNFQSSTMLPYLAKPNDTCTVPYVVKTFQPSRSTSSKSKKAKLNRTVWSIFDIKFKIIGMTFPMSKKLVRNLYLDNHNYYVSETCHAPIYPKPELLKLNSKGTNYVSTYDDVWMQENHFWLNVSNKKFLFFMRSFAYTKRPNVFTLKNSTFCLEYV